MITLYRDHESERVLSNKESTHFTVASISDVNTLTCSMRSGSCVGCQHLQTRVKDLEESLAVVSVCMYSDLQDQNRNFINII